MKKYNDLQSFRHPSQDPRQISERSLVCENPPRCFLFAQMTVGLGECYERIRNGDGENKEICLQNQSANEEKFSPITGSILAGRYKVIAKVGEGQSSLLFRAEDIFHPKKRHVAIKILHASYQNLGPQEASCLLHLKKADFLKVANIAHILNVFTVGQHFCMVFEFLSPTPLYKYFQMFPFPSKVEKVNLIRKVAFQVTQCLAVLSSVNIIHADIKPENILFTNGDKNDVKIIDFGNAIYWNHDEMSLYFGSFELQTVFYRAPEVMFGLPFGPQIDMWSLGCVLAELYLGEPLFLATSKDEILEKMQALLGPFPMSPFQSGKYFSNFKKFVGRVKSVPGYSQNVVNILRKLGSTDYIFADFIARLLTFDPGLRLSPLEAVRHPFLAPECALGLLLPPGYWTQESSNSRILLTPSTYPHRPKIDEKIKKLHYSELDFLRVGTRADDGKADRAGRADNVMKVLPFNYQDESSTGNNENTGEVTNGGNTEGESDSAVERDQTDRLYDNDTRIIFGVESTENVDASRPSAKEDTRYSDFNESCSVLHTTEKIRFIPDPPKDHQKQNSGMFVNRNSNEIHGMMDRNASGKSYSIVNTTKREQPIPVKKGRKYSTSLKSFVKPGNMKETGSSKGSLREFPSSGDTSSLPKTLNVHLSPNFANKTAAKEEHINSCDAVNSAADKGSYNLPHEQRDNTFNESCGVKILFTNPSFSKAEAQKRSSRRRRKYILKKKTSRVSKQSGSETESCCSASTDMPEDNSRTPCMTRSKSPATTPALSPEIKSTSGKSVAEKEIDNSSSPARRTTLLPEKRISKGSPMSSTHLVVGEENPIISSETSKDSSSVASHEELASDMVRRTNRTVVEKRGFQKGSSNRKINMISNATTSPEAIFNDSSKVSSDKEENSNAPPARRTSDRRYKPNSDEVGQKYFVHSLEENDRKSKGDIQTSKAKETENLETLTFTAGGRYSEETKTLRSRKIESNSTNKARTTTISPKVREATSTTTSNEYQNEQYSNSLHEIISSTTRSDEVCSSTNASVAGGSRHQVPQTASNSHSLNAKVKKPSSKNSANLQELSDKEGSPSVTKSRNKRSIIKKSLPEKLSSLDSFFDALSDDETGVVSSNTGVFHTKSDRTKSFSEDKTSPISKERLTPVVTSTTKQNRSPVTIDDNYGLITPPKSSNFRSFYGKVPACKDLQEIRTYRKSDEDKSKMLSAQTKNENETPKRLPRKESVFDTPSSDVSSTGNLLPGGLSEVEKATVPGEQKRGNSLAEVHNIFQQPFVESTQTSSGAAGRNKGSGKARRNHEIYKQAPAKKKTSGRNNKCVGEKVMEESEDRSHDLIKLLNEKPDSRPPGETIAFENLPTDILTQDLVRQSRKRKLKYASTNSPDKINSMSCLDSLRDRQTVKIQKLAGREFDDLFHHEEFTENIQEECPPKVGESLKKGDDGGAIGKESASPIKKNAHESKENAGEKKCDAKQRQLNKKQTEDNRRKKDENTKQRNQHTVKWQQSTNDGERFENPPLSISNDFRTFGRKEKSLESCSTKNTICVEGAQLKGSEGLLLAGDRRQNKLEDVNRKHSVARRNSGDDSPSSIFGDIFRRKGQKSDPDELSDDDYEVLLL